MLGNFLVLKQTNPGLKSTSPVWSTVLPATVNCACATRTAESFGSPRLPKSSKAPTSPNFFIYMAAWLTSRRGKQVEEALKVSEERYRMLFEAFPEAISLMDIDMNVIMENPCGAQLFGTGRLVRQARRAWSSWRRRTGCGLRECS